MIGVWLGREQVWKGFLNLFDDGWSTWKNGLIEYRKFGRVYF